MSEGEAVVDGQDLGAQALELLREAERTPDYPTGHHEDINGPIIGPEGEPCPGAVWTGSYLNNDNSHIRPPRVIRCAVLRGDEYGPKLYAWNHWRWEIQSGYLCVKIAEAWGLAMLERAERAEWLAAGLTAARDAAWSEAEQLRGGPTR
jgi:hypothetical protein